MSDGLSGLNGSAAIANHAAVSELKRGCEELKKPLTLATELVHFLQLRRLHGSALSPGRALDELWHWLLLNTEVANAVYELLGGQIHHSTMRTCDDVELGFRRAKAFSLMYRNGCNPNVEFWQEPGTYLHTLKEHKLKVSGVEPILVFASSLSSEEDIIKLAHQVWGYPPSQLTLLQSDEGSSPLPGCNPLPSASGALAPIKRERVEKGGSGTPAKRAAIAPTPATNDNSGSAPQHPEASPKLRIKLRPFNVQVQLDDSRPLEELEFLMKHGTLFSKVFSVFAQKVGRPVDELRFLYGPWQLNPYYTPAAYRWKTEMWLMSICSKWDAELLITLHGELL